MRRCGYSPAPPDCGAARIGHSTPSTKRSLVSVVAQRLPPQQVPWHGAETITGVDPFPARVIPAVTDQDAPRHPGVVAVMAGQELAAVPAQDR